METIKSTDGTVHTPQELRTSSNNMLCVVTYEPQSDEVQTELEELLAVGN